MQFCAIVAGTLARIDSSAVLVLSLADRFRLLKCALDADPPLDVIVAPQGDCVDFVRSMRLSLCACDNAIVLPELPSLILRYDGPPPIPSTRCGDPQAVDLSPRRATESTKKFQRLQVGSVEDERNNLKGAHVTIGREGVRKGIEGSKE